MDIKAEFGIIGGSGFYSFLENMREFKVETPYGSPSDLVAVGEHKGKTVAFIPRHGKLHQYPPHRIPYRANLWAMKTLGVKRIIAPTAVGSLQADYKIGDLVITDQFIDMTNSREYTFYEGPVTTHVSMADPYCPELRKIAIESLEKLGYRYKPNGTVVVIQGPRFSTKAESTWFTKNGWHIINMTQYPEVVLARELGICYLNISVVTDYDVGIVAEGGVEPVTQDTVIKVFNENIGKLKELLKLIIEDTPGERNCLCKDSLKNARVGE